MASWHGIGIERRRMAERDGNTPIEFFQTKQSKHDDAADVFCKPNCLDS